MKKILLSLSIIASLVTGAKAQTAPDFGFETWHAIAAPFITIEDPNGWASLNALTATGTAQSVFKETTAPAAGTISAKIVTVKVVGSTIPNPYGGNLDTAGILAIGAISLAPAGITYGYTFPHKPGVLSFQSKYNPNGLDSAYVIAYMTHWNGTSRDTVASGRYATGTNTGSSPYTLNSLTMVYKPAFASVIPDTEEVFISSSIYRSHHGAKTGSTFYIDDLQWSEYVSTNDIGSVKSTVSTYPNPAIEKVTIECSISAKAVQVMDITGRLLGSYPMNNNKVEIPTSDMVKGIYLYSILDAHNNAISKGKFEVIK